MKYMTEKEKIDQGGREYGHKYFDLLWSKKALEERGFKNAPAMTRKEAYVWLASQMTGGSLAKAHFALFSNEQCNKAVELVLKKLAEVYSPPTK